MGMYCVAFGEPARRCAVTCIRSFKAHMPNVPVAFCGVSPLDAGEDVFVERPDLDVGGRLAKLAMYDATLESWEYVLYLDADTETVGDLSALYAILRDGWELVICWAAPQYRTVRHMRLEDAGEREETLALLGCVDLFQYNGGVLAFRRCENVRAFFELWGREWPRYAMRDQGALLRALYQRPVKLWVMGNEWNAYDGQAAPAGEVALWHYNMKARRWATVKQWEAVSQ